LVRKEEERKRRKEEEEEEEGRKKRRKKRRKRVKLARHLALFSNAGRILPQKKGENRRK